MLAANRFKSAIFFFLFGVFWATGVWADETGPDAGVPEASGPAVTSAPVKSAGTLIKKTENDSKVKAAKTDEKAAGTAPAVAEPPRNTNDSSGPGHVADGSESKSDKQVSKSSETLNPVASKKGVSPKTGTRVKAKGKRFKRGKKTKRLRKKNRRRRKAKRTARRRSKKRSLRQRWPTKRPKVSTAIPALGRAPYASGERLFFKLEMFGTVAGEVALVVGKTSTVGGRETQELVGFIRGSEFLNKFYPVNNRLDALVDSKTMLPLKSNFFIREKGVKSDYHTVFDHKKRLIRSIRFKKKKKLYRNFTQLTNIYESLGSIYGVRRMDLKVGMTFNYYIWDSRKERLIRVHVVGEERILTDAGWFDTLRLDVSAQITGGFMRDKKLKAPIRKGSLWIAKDRYRTPVKVLTPTKLGDATATLVRRVNDSSVTK